MLGATWASIRTLRFADGPDEVHCRAIAREEFGKYADLKAKPGNRRRCLPALDANAMTREAAIVSTARTPIGKAHRGAFNATMPDVLAAHAIDAAIDRAGIDPERMRRRDVGHRQPIRPAVL